MGIEWPANFITPSVIPFAIIVLGYFLGKIRIFGIAFDVSAILIVSVLAGLFVLTLDETSILDTYHTSMDLLSKLGTSFFISAIGISAGQSMASGINKKHFIFFGVGALTVIVGFAAMKIISCFDESIHTSLLLGILCGSLTSTPGLTAVCEMQGIISELSILGYGCSYLGGVIGVVVFVQCATKNTTSRIDVCSKGEKTRVNKSDIDSLIYVSATVILGCLISSFKIPYISISCGNSGGMLCSGIVMGFVLQKRRKGLDREDISLSIYRNCGLIMFFVGSGVQAGMRFDGSFELKWFAYGILLTIIPILFGYFFCRYVMKKNLEISISAVAGGMTSTPAMGTLLKNKKKVDLSVYSMTYMGALFMTVIGVQMLL